MSVVTENVSLHACIVIGRALLGVLLLLADSIYSIVRLFGNIG